MIAHFGSARDLLVLHAGDCLLGRYDDKTGIDWVSKPHTLANVAGNALIPDIVDVPARQRLTRSFRAREFTPPAVLAMKFDRELVIATNGFWAELASGDQALFLNGRDVPIGTKSDDRSVLCLRPLESVGTPGVQSVGKANNLYLR